MNLWGPFSTVQAHSPPGALFSREEVGHTGARTQDEISFMLIQALQLYKHRTCSTAHRAAQQPLHAVCFSNPDNSTLLGLTSFTKLLLPGGSHCWFQTSNTWVLRACSQRGFSRKGPQFRTVGCFYSSQMCYSIKVLLHFSTSTQ